MIFQQLSQQLAMLSNLLSSISNEHYTHCINHLGNASIGGHTRHIIELLQCAVTGYHKGAIDYINRQRNLVFEQDKVFALAAFQKIEAAVKLTDKPLRLVTEMISDRPSIPVTTTYYREIVYNTEHVIHHLALIKVALIEMGLDVVSHDFGIAYSTLEYKATQKEEA